MDCTYINLDAQLDRRREFEDQFRRHAPPHWRLARTPATGVHDARVLNAQGPISAGEKGCFLSHLGILEAHRRHEHPLFIFEDDACLGPQGGAAVDQLMRSLPEGFEWDLIFTDVVVASADAMVRLAALRTALMKARQVQLLNLKDLLFAGSAAYIVNPRSVDRLLTLLRTPEAMDRPYDLRLRHLCHAGHLKAWTAFPFLTTVSLSAETSQIQRPGASNADGVWNTFRRLMWIDGQVESNREALERIRRDICDDSSEAVGTVIAACLSSRFVSK